MPTFYPAFTDERAQLNQLPNLESLLNSSAFWHLVFQILSLSFFQMAKVPTLAAVSLMVIKKKVSNFHLKFFCKFKNKFKV